jgi:hypothetical protein
MNEANKTPNHKACQQCGSDRLFKLEANAKDGHSYEYKGTSGYGYAPHVNNVCNCDCTQFVFCLECGQIQGHWPVVLSDGDVIDAINEMSG